MTEQPDTEDVWARLRAPFDTSWIEKLPKPLQRNDDNKGRCQAETPANGRGGPFYSADGYYCGGWHARSVHLDYIGHAGITMRLNDVVGPAGWDLEPVATTDDGLPLMRGGEFWARLTILDVSKVDLAANYNSTQEAWGDALRRTAMRFGIGTYLWAKSEFAAELAAYREPSDARAQEVADLIDAGKLTDLDQAVAEAKAGGYLEHVIRLGEGEGTLAAYIEHARTYIEAPKAPQEVASGAEETPAPPPATDEPTAPPAGRQEAAQPPENMPADIPAANTAAPRVDPLELARATLEERDPQAIRTMWEMADAAGVLNADVIAVVGDDDLAAIDLTNTTRMPLRGLLIAANGYVTRHNAAIRDLGAPIDTPPVEDPPADPWPQQ